MSQQKIQLQEIELVQPLGIEKLDFYKARHIKSKKQYTLFVRNYFDQLEIDIIQILFKYNNLEQKLLKIFGKSLEFGQVATLKQIDHYPFKDYLEQSGYAIMYILEPLTYNLQGVFSERVSAQKNYQSSEVIYIIKAAAAALKFLHENGMYHGQLDIGSISLNANKQYSVYDVLYTQFLDDIVGTIRQQLQNSNSIQLSDPNFNVFSVIQDTIQLKQRTDIRLLGKLGLVLLSGQQQNVLEEQQSIQIAQKNHKEELVNLVVKLLREEEVVSLEDIIKELSNMEQQQPDEGVYISNFKKTFDKVQEKDMKYIVQEGVGSSEIYYQIGKYKQAQDCVERAVTAVQKLYGKDNYNTGNVILRKARILRQLDEEEQSLSQYKRVLEIKSQYKTEPQYQVDIAQSLRALGQTYIEFGQEEQAEKCLKKSLYMIENSIGRRNVYAGQFLETLGQFYEQDEFYLEAKYEYKRALISYQSIYGEQHTKIAELHLKIGEMLWQDNQNEEAQVHTRQAINILEQLGFINLPLYCDTLAVLGQIYESEIKYDDAISLYNKAIDVMRGIPGNVDSQKDIARYTELLRDAYKSSKNYQRAIEYGEKALVLRKETSGEENEEYIQCQYDITRIYVLQDKKVEALKTLKNIVKIIEKAKEEPCNSKLIIKIYEQAAMLSLELKQNNEAITYGKEVVEWRKKRYQQDLYRKYYGEVFLGNIYVKCGVFKQAQKFLENSLKNIYEFLGELPEKVLPSLHDLRICFEKNNQKNKIPKLDAFILNIQKNKKNSGQLLNQEDEQWVSDTVSEFSESDEEVDDDGEDDEDEAE